MWILYFLSFTVGYVDSNIITVDPDKIKQVRMTISHFSKVSEAFQNFLPLSLYIVVLVPCFMPDLSKKKKASHFFFLETVFTLSI